MGGLGAGGAGVTGGGGAAFGLSSAGRFPSLIHVESADRSSGGAIFGSRSALRSSSIIVASIGADWNIVLSSAGAEYLRITD